MNKEKSEKKPTTRKRAPRSPKSVRLIVERHYIGNVPMNTLFQRLAEEEIRKTRILPLANWTFYCGKGLASSRSIRYNVIDEVSFPLWRYTWKRTKK